MKAVLWDLDGTLVDSEEFHWLSWRDTMRPEGVEQRLAPYNLQSGLHIVTLIVSRTLLETFAGSRAWDASVSSVPVE